MPEATERGHIFIGDLRRYVGTITFQTSERLFCDAVNGVLKDEPPDEPVIVEAG